VISAWSQVGAFAALVIAGWWVGPGFPHDDDGVEIPLRRLAEKRAHASTIDPLIPTPSPN
jgi:hypothetical protein